MSERKHAGIGRVLIAVYAVLAMAATGRSFVQIVQRFEEAPLAYALSAVAAVVYGLATVALAGRSDAWRRVALAAVCFELVGVLVVGTLSLVAPELFTTRSGAVRVVAGGIADGQTIQKPDSRHFPPGNWDGLPSQLACTGIAAEAVIDLIEETLVRQG